MFFLSGMVVPTQSSSSSEGGRKISYLQKVGACLANIVRPHFEEKDLIYM